MNKTMYIAALLCTGALIQTTSAWACDAAGKNTHVGQVISVDGKQFTLRDAQSGQPINFTADPAMQGVLPIAGDRVAVQYFAGEQGLIAETVR